ncbi:hypothetical protein [Lacticaseibacillus daqingensis]|uniref:hypothetical protein n=1 Tax=Lacticaseibacillus daqingensis TaxID=2486014 RepID=UPI000F7A11FA|nr:hypothetical protein [Lacticaseibacillus daqingensis]
MVILTYILLFLLTGGLVVTITARLHAPLNFVVDAVVGVILLSVAFKFLGAGPAFGLLIWLAGLVGGLYALRTVLRKG